MCVKNERGPLSLTRVSSAITSVRLVSWETSANCLGSCLESGGTCVLLSLVRCFLNTELVSALDKGLKHLCLPGHCLTPCANQVSKVVKMVHMNSLVHD